MLQSCQNNTVGKFRPRDEQRLPLPSSPPLGPPDWGKSWWEAAGAGELMRHIRRDLRLVSGVTSPLISFWRATIPLELWLGHKTAHFMNYASLNTFWAQNYALWISQHVGVKALSTLTRPPALDTHTHTPTHHPNANRLAAVYTCAACQQLCSRPLITHICFSLQRGSNQHDTHNTTLWDLHLCVYCFLTPALSSLVSY